MLETTTAHATGLANRAAASLAVTGGEFNALPWIIGAAVLVVLGGGALRVVRLRRNDDAP